MKALIIEDELPAARRLQKLIASLNVTIEILAVIDSVTTTVEWLENNPQPDLIFLDINLADGLSFEIFKRTKITAPIIFTTAYDEYALKAFEVNSIDYLLKPIELKKLERSIEKLQDLKKSSSNLPPQFEKLLANFQPNKQHKERFLIRIADRLLTIEEHQIALFKAEGKNTFIVTKNGQSFSVDNSLDDLEELLNPHYFFRLNRQFIARIDSILGVFNFFNGKLKIKLQSEQSDSIFVSREKSGKFKAWLDGNY